MSGCSCIAPARPPARQRSGIEGGRIQSITLDPPAGDWAALVRTAPRDETARTLRHQFRDQLGMPTDRPIVMSGHQAALWHPGILAKLLAASALAARTNAAVAWLIVDVDKNIPGRLRLPIVDEAGRLSVHEWDAVGTATPGVAFAREAGEPTHPGFEEGWRVPDRIAERVERIIDALRAHKSAPSLAEQVTGAVFDLLEPVTPRPIVVHASAFAKTDLFRAIISRAIADPDALRASYNEAAGAIASAGVRGLGKRADGSLELPLWRIDGPYRLPVFDTDLASTPIERLLPRGMLMTAMARLAGCELFIHGLGGRVYEPINDLWFGEWMRESGGRDLAPFVTATADVMLDLEGEAVPEQDAERARWRAHHAQHHPGELGDEDRQHERDRLVRTIRELPRASAERERAYRELHDLLGAARRAHSSELRELEARARELTIASAGADVRSDRSWSVGLHDAETLIALRNAVDARFGA